MMEEVDGDGDGVGDGGDSDHHFRVNNDTQVYFSAVDMRTVDAVKLFGGEYSHFKKIHKVEECLTGIRIRVRAGTKNSRPVGFLL